MHTRHILLHLAFVSSLTLSHDGFSQEIVGIVATPHQFSREMQWRRPPNSELASKIELFLRSTQVEDLELSPPLRFDGKVPSQLLADDEWAWHDTPASWQTSQVALPPKCLTVWTINGKSAAWGVGTKHRLQLGKGAEIEFAIDKPLAWLSAVTFLSVDTDSHTSESVHPNKIAVHLFNGTDESLRIRSLQIWLPRQGASHHVFHKSREYDDLSCFPHDGVVAPQNKGGFNLLCEPLPLTYAVLEVRVQHGTEKKEESLWAHVRVKREVFDISGGWVASDVNGRNSLTIDQYLDTLKRMHINTGQIEEVGGFTDQPDRYARLPLKRFNRLWPTSRYETDEMLPTVHAVEFLGEPQYGGGRPVPPQEVWEKLAPYQPSRLPTSLTLSEEHSWRYYAGLSDYPHYDAYRVTAPAADSWRAYDRWDGVRIRWGAPLETIGVMTRSLRENSRPRPIAYWSQGAHDGWRSRWNPRRSSPTPDELRSQAWHGLANRITSLYWFNLSLKSLIKFPDLIDPITRVNREIRMLDDIFLDGDAFEHRRLETQGKADWDLDSIATPTAVLLVAHDLRYKADPEKREFAFTTRDGTFSFARPRWLEGSIHVFRVDADGTHDVTHSISDDHIEVSDRVHVVGVYLATPDASLRDRLDTNHSSLIRHEQETGFDPANSAADLEQLQRHVGP